jgi:hypothetical protein
VTIWFAGLLTFAAVGAWLAFSTSLPMMWSAGAVAGFGVGVLVVMGYLHLLERAPHHRPGDPKPGL